MFISVFLWNLLDLKRVRWEGEEELSPGKHTLEFDFKYDGLGFATLAFNNISGLGQAGIRQEWRLIPQKRALSKICRTSGVGLSRPHLAESVKRSGSQCELSLRQWRAISSRGNASLRLLQREPVLRCCPLKRHPPRPRSTRKTSPASGPIAWRNC